MDLKALLTFGIRNRVPIVVDGDRTKPTGKSTLCALLRRVGAEAYESWELEEGVKKPDQDGAGNYGCIKIQLNQALSDEVRGFFADVEEDISALVGCRGKAN